MKNSEQVKSVIFRTAGNHKWLSLGIAVSVCGAVVTSLIPPLILGKIIDGLTAGQALAFSMVLSYFGMLALTGLGRIPAGGISDCIWPEDHPRVKKQSDGQIYPSGGRRVN